jgi:diguanylate cyclase (GGDEF)-like protein
MDAVLRFAPARWPLWRIPAPLLVSVLVVELTAVVLVALGLVGSGPVPGGVLLDAIVIVGLGMLHTEVSCNVERIRRRLRSGLEVHINLASVWFFAAAVLLPPAYAACATVLVHGHLRLRSVSKRAPLYRDVFTSATFALSSLAASTGMTVLAGRIGQAPPVEVGDGGAVGVIVVGMLIFFTVNTALVGGAIAMSEPEATLSGAIGDGGDNLLELATLCLGAIVAVAVMVHPAWVLFLFPALLVLHRAVLVRHLEQRASTDGKTGLLNATAWHTQAEKELRRARKRDAPRGVLVIDLDHFKQVNDRHGHLAGDHVLAAVAQALRAEVRDRDLVGRFGGEEFVVLLAGGPTGDDGTAELTAVAERIRLRIAGLYVEMPTPDGPLTVTGLSASVGAAFSPQHGTELRELLQVADTALYAAKRAGRNAVRAGVPAPRPAPVDQAETR